MCLNMIEFTFKVENSFLYIFEINVLFRLHIVIMFNIINNNIACFFVYKLSTILKNSFKNAYLQKLMKLFPVFRFSQNRKTFV